MVGSLARQTRKRSLLAGVRKYWPIYLLLIPPLVVLIWFRYVPMYGVQLAFKDYNMRLGITASPWAGMKHFEMLFRTPQFLTVVRNTLLINFYSLIFQFPVPILFALLINECRFLRYKRVIQTVSYLPHFLSWVVISALFENMLALDTGIVNRVIQLFGGEQQVFLSSTRWFRTILICADIWHSAGWGTIVILSAITSIDPCLYEAAVMDGASKIKRLWHVTLPGIRSTIVVLLIMRMGYALSDNVEEVLMFYNQVVYSVGDVLGTYIYRYGLGQMKYSYTTAAGLFSSAVGMVLLLLTNRAAHAMGERGLW